MSEQSETQACADLPKTGVTGLIENLRFDIISGFLVFLIALPLCLSISLAYGYPAIAGVFTAIIGGVTTGFVSNSELTIKGPAAGLIGIAAPCVTAFGWSGISGDVNIDAYRSALAVGVAAGVIQIFFGLSRAGVLGEFFPTSAVHGMLAAIGVIIIAKVFPQTVGVVTAGKPIPLLMAIPRILQNLNPPIAVVGGVSLAIMFLWPLFKTFKVKVLSSIPAALVVAIVSIPLAAAMNVPNEHNHKLAIASAPEHGAPAAPKKPEPTKAETKNDTMVQVPAFGETFNALTTPKFDVLWSAEHAKTAWYFVIMFAVIGTLESMLTAKAMDLIDPWQRKTSLDRDNTAVGIANTLCALVGAPPMISEIVRSRANMDSGARTRYSNMVHGIFLLLFVTLLPAVITMIPIAALMAMLIYTGYRLAHPKEFVHMFHIGVEQLLVYCATIVGVMATDLLKGIAIGIAVEFVVHLINGLPIGSLFKPDLTVEQVDRELVKVCVRKGAVFTNWLLLKRELDKLCTFEQVTIDLSQTRLVDHTVMAKLQEAQREYSQKNCKLAIIGLDDHHAFSSHPLSARKKAAV